MTPTRFKNEANIDEQLMPKCLRKYIERNIEKHQNMMPTWSPTSMKHRCRMAWILKKHRALLSEDESRRFRFEGPMQTNTFERAEKHDGEHH